MKPLICLLPYHQHTTWKDSNWQLSQKYILWTKLSLFREHKIYLDFPIKWNPKVKKSEMVTVWHVSMENILQYSAGCTMITADIWIITAQDNKGNVSLLLSKLNISSHWLSDRCEWFSQKNQNLSQNRESWQGATSKQEKLRPIFLSEVTSAILFAHTEACQTNKMTINQPVFNNVFL